MRNIDRYVENHRQEVIDDLRKLVEIPSVAVPGCEGQYPFGDDVAAALEKALTMASDKGMCAENYGYWYGLAKAGNGPHTIGIFSHLDVVEVDDRWTYPPFQLTVKDGWMIGRGTNDDKIAAVIGFYVAQAMKELQIGKNIQLQVYLGCCEEKGMSDLAKYLSEQQQPEFSMVPDFIFPVSIGESGIVKIAITKNVCFDEFIGLEGGTVISRTPIDAKAVYVGTCKAELIECLSRFDNICTEENDRGVLITASGKNDTGFGTNDAINAISVLMSALKSFDRLTDKDKSIVEELEMIASDKTGEIMKIAYSDRVNGSLSSKCVKMMQADSEITFWVDIRVPGAIDLKNLLVKIEEFSKNSGYSLEIIRSMAGSYVPADDPRVQIINQAWNEISGNQDIPRTGGGTYAGRLKNAVAFGPKNMDRCTFLPEGHGDLHGPDEAMNIDMAMTALKVYIRAIALLDEFYATK